MPVDIDDFESSDTREPSVPEQVVAFLQLNRSHGFTRSEIVTEIDADSNTVGTALSRLEDRDLVRHKGDHWAIVEDEDRVIDAYDLHAVSERLADDDDGIDPDELDAVVPDGLRPSSDRDTDSNGNRGSDPDGDNDGDGDSEN